MVGKGKIIIRRIALEAADEIRRGVLDQDVVDGLLERRFFIGLIAVAKAVVVAPVRVGIFRGDVVCMRKAAGKRAADHRFGIGGVEVAHQHGGAIVLGMELFQTIHGQVQLVNPRFIRARLIVREAGSLLFHQRCVLIKASFLPSVLSRNTAMHQDLVPLLLNSPAQPGSSVE